MIKNWLPIADDVSSHFELASYVNCYIGALRPFIERERVSNRAYTSFLL